ncbi:hypothetical protein BgiMline_030314 [Biomphalaria glabrata]|nr:hypothetical protein BgiMline_032864 [Biomphalaria glabrata]
MSFVKEVETSKTCHHCFKMSTLLKDVITVRCRLFSNLTQLEDVLPERCHHCTKMSQLLRNVTAERCHLCRKMSLLENITAGTCHHCSTMAPLEDVNLAPRWRHWKM